MSDQHSQTIKNYQHYHFTFTTNPNPGLPTLASISNLKTCHHPDPTSLKLLTTTSPPSTLNPYNIHYSIPNNYILLGSLSLPGGGGGGSSKPLKQDLSESNSEDPKSGNLSQPSQDPSTLNHDIKLNHRIVSSKKHTGMNITLTSGLDNLDGLRTIQSIYTPINETDRNED